jgi:hypothetical protein
MYASKFNYLNYRLHIRNVIAHLLLPGPLFRREDLGRDPDLLENRPGQDQRLPVGLTRFTTLGTILRISLGRKLQICIFMAFVPFYPRISTIKKKYLSFWVKFLSN